MVTLMTISREGLMQRPLYPSARLGFLDTREGLPAGNRIAWVEGCVIERGYELVLGRDVDLNGRYVIFWNIYGRDGYVVEAVLPASTTHKEAQWYLLQYKDFFLIESFPFN